MFHGSLPPPICRSVSEYGCIATCLVMIWRHFTPWTLWDIHSTRLCGTLALHSCVERVSNSSGTSQAALGRVPNSFSDVFRTVLENGSDSSVTSKGFQTIPESFMNMFETALCDVSNSSMGYVYKQRYVTCFKQPYVIFQTDRMCLQTVVCNVSSISRKCFKHALYNMFQTALCDMFANSFM